MQALPGFRDFLPEDCAKRNYVFARWREVARRYAFTDGQGEVGFISSVSQPFCGDCTRSRLSSDGVLYTCLFATHGTSGTAERRLRDATHGWADGTPLRGH